MMLLTAKEINYNYCILSEFNGINKANENYNQNTIKLLINQSNEKRR